jgi:hypothetical protein
VEVARGERAVDGLWQVLEEAGPPIPDFSPAPLPVPATPFVGRAGELGAIAARLADPACRLLTLTGPGGAGKTRLGLAAAQAFSSAGAGAAFIPLAALQDAGQLPDAVARSLA